MQDQKIKWREEKHLSELIKQDDAFLTEDILRQRLHFENTPLGVIEWDRNFRILKWNPSAERIFGYKANEAIGKTGEEILLTDDVKKHVNQIWKDLLARKGGTRSKNKNICKDGRIILCDWYNTTLIDDDGEVIGVSSLVADITAKEKSQKIQSALYQISQLVHTIEDINKLYPEIHRIVGGLMKTDNFYIALYDDETNIISFPYFVDEFDSPPNPCPLGRGLTDYVLRTGKDMLVDKDLDLKLREQGVTDLIGPSSEIWLGVSLKIKDKAIGVIVVQDYNDKTTYGEEEKQILTYVSEQIASAIRKKMDEEELKHYSEELKELNASKDRFFSIIAHDLRSPFHGLLGLANILHTEKNHLSQQEIEYYLEEIYGTTSNLYGLIENLLDWSRLQTNKTPFKPKTINVHSLVTEVEQILKNNRNLKSIQFKNLVDNTIEVYADEEMLRSLFNNLISNAIKFTHNNGEIKIESEITKDSKVQLTVTDNGIGIPIENIEKLFKIDTNISTAGTNKERGTGLGLLLCKEIADKHDTEIKVESESGKGTRFSFKLRLAENKENK